MKLKQKMYLRKINSLILTGVKKGLIVPFDDELYSELNKTIINTCPVDIDIKYLKPKEAPGKCYDRSLKMFYAMENSVLTRGSLEYFRVLFGEMEDVNHGWVERDNYVYDPTWLCRYDKDYYYKIFKVMVDSKCNHEEFCSFSENNEKAYKKVKSTTRETFKKDGFDRMMLSTTIPLLRGIASNNPKLKVELEKYLKEIDYDEKEIYQSLCSEIKKYMM